MRIIVLCIYWKRFIIYVYLVSWLLKNKIIILGGFIEMKKVKLFGLGVVVLVVGLFLGVCGNNGFIDLFGGKSLLDIIIVVLIIDIGGVDDCLFN